MSNRYQKSYRGYLIDHHSPDPPIVTLENLDVEEYEQFFKEANINHLMLYCKDHWGAAYYDTKVGRKHPGLKLDWIAALRPVLQRLKIEFNAYYCLEYETYAPITHPEWSTLKADGAPLRLTGRIPKWAMPCYETGYRHYVLEQLKEIVPGYQPDSLFLDIFGKSLCYCPACRAKFKRQLGYDIPETDEGLKQHNNDVSKFLDGCAKGMLEEIISAVKAIDPEIKVTINFAALYPKEIRDLLDYQFTEPWAGNWFSAAYSRDTAVGQYPQLGPGDVSEVYNYQPENIYILAAAQIAAQGCRVFFYSGSQHVDGTLEHEEARRVGAAYREVEKFEKYLGDREVIADIGIIQSDIASKIKASKSIVVNAIERAKQGSEHRDALLGAMKLCDYCKLTWAIIPEQELTPEKARRYQMLLLPEVFYVSERLKSLLEDYVKEGGLLLSAGGTGLYGLDGKILDHYALSELYGCEFVERVEQYRASAWGSYLQLSKENDWKQLPDTFPPVSAITYKAQCNRAMPLAWFVEPATEVTEEKWVNWWCPPPAHLTNNPAILENTFGMGKVIYSAFDLFKMEIRGFNLTRELFRSLIERNLKEPSIRLETDHRNTLGYVCYDRKEQREMIVHEVSHLAEAMRGDAPEIEGGVLNINQSFKHGIEKAELVYPVHQDLEITDTGNGCAAIKLPRLKIHSVIRIEYSK